MKEVLIQEYNNLTQLNIQSKKPENIFNYNFIEGSFLEILGPKKQEYNVTFTNLKKNLIYHQSDISNNMWTRTNAKYCVDCLIEVKEKDTNKVVFSHQFNPKGKRVYIYLDSSAIGDTLAWFPYVDEFRKKWDCHVVVSSFHNEWFESQYPELEFVNPGDQVSNLYAMFGIGWFYDDKKVDKSKIPIDFKRYPLQQTASEILNLEYTEIKPKISFSNKERNIKEKYVVIAPHASAHAKYWLYPNGWQQVIDYLKSIGYQVVLLTKEPLGDNWHDSKINGTLEGVIDKTGDLPIEDRMIDIKNADLFIGVGSGLSWISWALNTPTILISGFSYPYSEFQDCVRLSPEDTSLCRGCFNREWLNPGDWEWCPDHKDTPRQFECSKSITPSRVIKSIQYLLPQK